jgi:hypothetical protein
MTSKQRIAMKHALKFAPLLILAGCSASSADVDEADLTLSAHSTELQGTIDIATFALDVEWNVADLAPGRAEALRAMASPNGNKAALADECFNAFRGPPPPRSSFDNRPATSVQAFVQTQMIAGKQAIDSRDISFIENPIHNFTGVASNAQLTDSTGRFRLICSMPQTSHKALMPNTDVAKAVSQFDGKSYVVIVNTPTRMTSVSPSTPGAFGPMAYEGSAETLSTFQFLPLKKPPVVSPRYSELGRDGTLRVLEIEEYNFSVRGSNPAGYHLDRKNEILRNAGFTLKEAKFADGEFRDYTFGSQGGYELYTMALPAGGAYAQVEYRLVGRFTTLDKKRHPNDTMDLSVLQKWSDSADIVLTGGIKLADEFAGKADRYRIEIMTRPGENAAAFSKGSRHRLWTHEGYETIVLYLNDKFSFNEMIADDETNARNHLAFAGRPILDLDP